MGRKGTGQVMPFPHLPGPQGCCARGGSSGAEYLCDIPL